MGISGGDQFDVRCSRLNMIPDWQTDRQTDGQSVILTLVNRCRSWTMTITTA